MPYKQDGSDVPKYMRRAGAKRRRQWAHVFNSEWEKHKDKPEKEREEIAFAAANGVAGPNANKLAKADDESEREAFARALEKVLEEQFATLPSEVRESIESAALAGAGNGLLQVDVTNSKLISSTNEAAKDYAVNRAAELVGMKRDSEGNLVPNPDARFAISDTTRQKIRRIVANAFTKDTPITDIQKAIQRALRQEQDGEGIFSDARARMIARTEIMRAQTTANLNVWRKSGVVKKLQWLTVEDDKVCPECDSNDQAIVKIGRAFPSGARMPGDDHPLCRCILTAVAEETEKLAKVSKDTLILIMRHGATVWNEEDKLRSTSDIGLDESGRAAVAASAKSLIGLPISKIYSSLVPRAAESAKIAADILGVRIEYDEGLNAWNVGELVGLPHKALQPYLDDPSLVPVGGESRNTLHKRAVAAVERHEEKSFPDDLALLVTHDSILYALESERTGSAEYGAIPPAGVVSVRGHEFKRIVSDSLEKKAPTEESIRRMMTKLAYYAESGDTFDPEGNYLCGTCRLRVAPKEGEDRGKCLWVNEGKSGISMGSGSCDMYKHGLVAFGPEMALEHKFSQVDAGYAERPKEHGFGCKRCEYAESAKKDADGRELVCKNFETDGVRPHIQPKACCMAHDGYDMVLAPGEKQDS